MTSRIPDYAVQPAFATAVAADPLGQLLRGPPGVLCHRPPARAGGIQLLRHELHPRADDHRACHPRLLRRAAHQADHRPAGLRSMCYAPYTCPAADAARMPTGYFDIVRAPSLLGKPMPPLALTWAQGAGAIVSSLQDMTTWDRDLYLGRELPPRQQRQLESLVSETTGQPIANTTPPTRPATDSASSSSPTSRSERYGLTKAGPSATGSCTSTSLVPASSSRSPSTAQPTQPTTNSARWRYGLPDPAKGRRSTRGLKRWLAPRSSRPPRRTLLGQKPTAAPRQGRQSPSKRCEAGRRGRPAAGTSAEERKLFCQQGARQLV